jgi:hypothetical protein
MSQLIVWSALAFVCAIGAEVGMLRWDTALSGAYFGGTALFSHWLITRRP